MTPTADLYARLVLLAGAELTQPQRPSVTGASLTSRELGRVLGMTTSGDDVWALTRALLTNGLVRIDRPDATPRQRVWPVMPYVGPPLPGWGRVGESHTRILPWGDVLTLREVGTRWVARCGGATVQGLSARHALDMLATDSGDLRLMTMDAP